MTVLILMPLATQRGGAEKLLRLFVEQASDQPINLVLVFFEDGPLRHLFHHMGLETEVIPTGRLRQPVRYMQSIRTIAQSIETYDADLVFSWMPKAHLYGGWAARLRGVPDVWYQHGTPQLGWMDRLVTLVPADRVIACSRHVTKMQNELWPARSTTVVYPAVDLSDFNYDSLPLPPQARRELGLPVDGPLIGLVGRLQQWKGVHVLLDAMPHVLKQHPSSHAIIVGGEHALEPDYPGFLNRRIEALGLEQAVQLVGYQSNIPLWMQAMDVIVHASNREPFGMVVIEAMALGKPVVAGANGGPAEIITPGTDGLLAPYGDAGTLSAQILRYLNAPNRMMAIGAAAQRRARDFSVERFTQNLLKSLDAVMATSRTHCA
jgi:glycosyltransferase involved in cell wall biosynthesis